MLCGAIPCPPAGPSPEDPRGYSGSGGVGKSPAAKGALFQGMYWEAAG